MKAIVIAFLVALFGGFLALWLLSSVFLPPTPVPVRSSIGADGAGLFCAAALHYETVIFRATLEAFACYRPGQIV
jgi:hypothetical protein